MDIRKLALETCPSRFSRRNKKRFLSALDEIFEEEGYAGKDIDKRRSRRPPSCMSSFLMIRRSVCSGIRPSIIPLMGTAR